MVMRYLMVCLLAVCAIAAPSLARWAHAQDARTSRLQIAVVDQTGASIVGATVTLTGLESATRAAAPTVLTTNATGLAIVDRAVPGRYSVAATYPGFAAGSLPEIRARAGADTRLVVVLPLRNLEDAVTVGRGTQEDAADRRASEFGMKLGDDQIRALADDPEEMQRQLAELAGPDAVIRVDSFEGQQLPPKAQIKSIHVTRDQFAAEAANPGSTFVDIVTQPGIGPVRGQANLSYRNGAFTGRSQFTDRSTPEETRNYGANLGGTIVAGRTSFNASVSGQNDFTTPILNATTPTGVRAETLTVRQPTTRLNASLVVDHAVTRDQVLKVGVFLNRFKRENIGVGGYNLPDRGFSQEERNVGVRLQQAGPIGRRTFINTRLSTNLLKLDMHSVSEQAAIVVQDAFSTGGAQNEQFADVLQGSLASDVDYVRGIHSWRAGVQLDFNKFVAQSRFNYLGTYTFATLDDYLAGQPILYTRSLGFPENRYHNIQGGVYVQDDIRVRKGLTFSPGVRYTRQTRLDDKAGFAPRFGFTWSPVENGATTIRGSAGIFHGFLNLPTIEQTIRLDGERQREIYVRNPTYPDPGPVEALAIPTNKYAIGDFNLQRNVRYSAGIDHQFSPRVRANALYNHTFQVQQPRGVNVNPLVNGQRADARYANVIEAVTDAALRRHEVSVNATLSLARPGGATGASWFNWRRISMNLGFGAVHARTNSDGTWAVSPSGDLGDDWGPGPGDQPYRVQVLMTSTQVRDLTVNLTYASNSGAPYTLFTGFDDNGDGFLNDRPAGVGLRSLRGDGQQTLTVRAQYALAMSRAVVGQPGAPPRYRMMLFVNIQNLTNHQNLGGYSGVMTSPNFQRATFVTNPRRVDMGMGINF